MKEIWEWVDSEASEGVDTASHKSVTARMIGTQSQLTKLVRLYCNLWPFIHFLLQCQTIENLDEITIIGAILYRGLDPAGKQLSGLFTGSPTFRKLIDDNDVNVRKVLDHLTVALK